MGGKMKANRLRFLGQPIKRLPIRHIRQAQRFRFAGFSAEKADLAAFTFLSAGLRALA